MLHQQPLWMQKWNGWPAMSVSLLCFALGIVVGRFVEPLSWAMLILAIFYITLFALHRNKVWLYLSIFCLGCFRIGMVQEYRPPWNITEEKNIAKIQGIVIEPPWPTHWFSSDPSSPSQPFYKNSFLIQAQQLAWQYQSQDGIRTDVWQKGATDIRVSLASCMPHIRYGDQVEILGKISIIPSPDNPGQVDTRLYWHSQGIYYHIKVKKADDIQILGRHHGYRWIAKIHELRARYLEILHKVVGKEEGNFLGALILGTRSLLSDSTVQSFQRTGVMHLLAISGLHVGILIYFLYKILRRLRLPLVLCWIILMAIAGLYALLTNLQTPVVRTVIMLWVYFSALLVRRSVNAVHTMSVAAMLILCYHPLELFQVGFQLTFLATLSIIKVYVPLATPMDKSQKKGWAYWRSYFGHYFWELTVVSVSTWMTTAPLVIYHFGYVSWLGALMSILTIPLVTLILTGTALLLFTPLGLSYGATVLGTCLSWAVWLVCHLVNTGANISWLRFYWLPPLAICLIIFYLWIMVASFWKRCNYATLALLLMMVMASGYARRLYEPESEVIIFSVGHGSAVYIKLPTGQRILYDCGSRSTEMGSRIILPFLQHRGITRLDALILSHFDSDHYNGVADVALGCQVDRIYTNAAFQSRGSRLVEALKLCGLTIFTAQHEQTFPDLPGLLFLDPGGHLKSRSGQVPDNELSLLVLLSFRDCRILLTADIGPRSMRFLSEDENLLQLLESMDVFFVPHHGGVLTNTPLLLHILQPQLAIVQSDTAVCHQRTLACYQQAGIPVYSTFLYGAMELQVTKNRQVLVKGYKQPNQPQNVKK